MQQLNFNLDQNTCIHRYLGQVGEMVKTVFLKHTQITNWISITSFLLRISFLRSAMMAGNDQKDDKALCWWKSWFNLNNKRLVTKWTNPSHTNVSVSFTKWTFAVFKDDDPNGEMIYQADDRYDDVLCTTAGTDRSTRYKNEHQDDLLLNF